MLKTCVRRVNDNFISSIIYGRIQNVSCLLNYDRNSESRPGIYFRHYSSQQLNYTSVINNFYQTVCSKFKNSTLKPSINVEKIAREKANPLWKAKLHLTWPKEFTFENIGNQKAEAVLKVCEEAVRKLKEMKLLTDDYKPQLFTQDEIRKFNTKQRAPYPLTLNSNIQQKIEEYLINNKELETESNLFDRDSPFLAYKQESLIDIMTGYPIDITDDFEMKRSKFLLQKLKMQQNQISLPISSYKDEILQLIQENQIVVLSGETGCGKTTQVPQFIFDDYIEKLQGSKCNIVVTQPRRISAMSIAARVAKERKEQLQDSIGYQVRLDRMLLNERGGILFCSTGVLLQRLQDNPNLDGISHVIIDEAHERDVIIDLLMTLLKDLTSKNKSLRIIIMSASMNVAKLTSFFNDCPVVDIPGRMFPVKEYFLDEIVGLIGCDENKILQSSSRNKSEVNLYPELIGELICWIDANRPKGAILCFLPGWQDIQRVKTLLQCSLYDQDKYLIYPVHSYVSSSEQHLIFDEPPVGVRKIILATNIAETSITINDVAYVVDSGVHKQLIFNPNWGTASLTVTWVSNANVTQRKGRAGRTCPGECYHVFPKELLNNLKDFPTPEIQRISLENVILDTKKYCPEYKHAVEFLSRCPDPPSQGAIKESVNQLYKRGFVTQKETLTQLGWCAAQFSLHPYLSKAVIYGMWLRCLEPVLTVAAYLTVGKEPLRGTMENKDCIREVKLKFSNKSNSDHVAVSRLFQMWLNFYIGDRYSLRKFCEENLVNNNSMKFLSGLENSLRRRLEFLYPLEESVVEADGMKSAFSHYSNSICDNYRNSNSMIVTALSTAFAPNYLRCMQGELNKSGKLSENMWYKIV